MIMRGINLYNLTGGECYSFFVFLYKFLSASLFLVVQKGTVNRVYVCITEFGKFCYIFYYISSIRLDSFFD